MAHFPYLRLLTVAALLVLQPDLTISKTTTRCKQPPPRVKNGVFPDACIGALSGTICYAACSTGFAVIAESGSSQLSNAPAVPMSVCEDGRWSRATSNCKKVCQGMPLVQVAGVTWDLLCDSAVRPQQWCQGQCGPSMTGSPRVLCGRGGRWTSRTEGSCTDARSTVSCVNKPTIADGDFPDSCNNATAGSNCTAVCSYPNPGGAIPQATCLTDGSWSVPEATCPAPSIDDAALPVDVLIAVTNTCPDSAPAGSLKSVVFNVTADPLNADSITGVQLNISFPASLLDTSLTWVCVDSSDADLTCPQPNVQDPSAGFVVTSCLLGNIRDIGSATCTLTYVVPTTPLTTELNKITGTVSCDEAGSGGGGLPLPGAPPEVPGEGISENNSNNVVETCVV